MFGGDANNADAGKNASVSRTASGQITIASNYISDILAAGWSIVVSGGELAAGTDYVIAGIRESVYARSLPLATRKLQIVPARLGDRAGTVGLTSTLTDYIFDPRRIDASLG